MRGPESWKQPPMRVGPGHRTSFCAPHQLKELFLEWLRHHVPNRASPDRVAGGADTGKTSLRHPRAQVQRGPPNERHRQGVQGLCTSIPHGRTAQNPFKQRVRKAADQRVNDVVRMNRSDRCHIVDLKSWSRRLSWQKERWRARFCDLPSVSVEQARQLQRPWRLATGCNNPCGVRLVQSPSGLAGGMQ